MQTPKIKKEKKEFLFLFLTKVDVSMLILKFCKLVSRYVFNLLTPKRKTGLILNINFCRESENIIKSTKAQL